MMSLSQMNEILSQSQLHLSPMNQMMSQSLKLGMMTWVWIWISKRVMGSV